MSKILIKESTLINLMEAELKKSDVVALIKTNKDIEKTIKAITTQVIINLFKILWQHKSFYENMIKN